VIAYKAFEPGLVCLRHQFVMGLNVTEKANCRQNGFHCAANPLDCLAYYPDINKAVFCIVDAGGDINEDGYDSKISCTRLTIIKELTQDELFLHGLAYISDHPYQKWNPYVKKDHAKALRGYAVVRGADPAACGGLGDILALAKEDPASEKIIQLAMARVDGENILPGVWYGVDLTEKAG